ncbi:MAG: hypothetical protein II180_01795, partial [Proteobacteria bacterium]|nr:hypothetical protein [Pseudomonadota bacterium]
MSRGNTTAFGRPGSLNPLEDNSIRGANIYGDEGPHQTMLGLGTVNSQPASRSREFEEADRLAAGNHTIAGMPGIKLDLGNNVGRRSSESLMTASSARMNRATPVSQEPVPRSVAMNIAPSSKPVANSSLKIENDDPFAGLPGVSPAPVPSSLVDEEFVDLTAKLFGDDFAAGGNDIEDDDGWDFDIPVAETPVPAAVTASAPAPLSLNVGAKSASGAKTGYGDVSEEVLKTSEFESPAILEQLLSASSIQAQAIKKEDKSAEPAEASKPAEPAKVEAPVAKEEKPAAAAEKAPEAS